jgi:hypothetical protein
VSRSYLLERRVAGKRLGRHVHHDPKSRAFGVAYDTTAPLVSAVHERHCPAYDQGSLGSCTGNAGAGALMTGPLWAPGRMLTQDDAVQVYEAATHIDRIPGHYPPDDTGSTGLAVAKALKLAGFIREYRHAFSLHAALAALGQSPVLIGIGWRDGFDEPVGPRAELRISGEVRGGHELYLSEIDVEAQMVRGWNSWGEDWGDGGQFSMTFETLGDVLADLGDATILVP